MNTYLAKNNRGFTLVEILVTLAVLSAIMVGLTMTVNTILTTANIAKDRAIAYRQVQNAGFWITRDIQLASVPPLITGINEFTLSMTCFTGATSTETTPVIYNYNPAYKTLTRTANGSSMEIAKYILEGGARITAVIDNRTKYIFNITTEYGRSGEVAGKYEVERRIQ